MKLPKSWPYLFGIALGFIAVVINKIFAIHVVLGLGALALAFAAFLVLANMLRAHPPQNFDVVKPEPKPLLQLSKDLIVETDHDETTRIYVELHNNHDIIIDGIEILPSMSFSSHPNGMPGFGGNGLDAVAFTPAIAEQFSMMPNETRRVEVYNTDLKVVFFNRPAKVNVSRNDERKARREALCQTLTKQVAEHPSLLEFIRSEPQVYCLDIRTNRSEGAAIGWAPNFDRHFKIQQNS